jgi:hypothetical protein
MIPPDLSAKKLRQTVAIGRNIRGRQGNRLPLTSRPQRGNVREFVLHAQNKNPILPRRHKGTELGTTDAHGLTRIKPDKKNEKKKINEYSKNSVDFIRLPSPVFFPLLLLLLLSVFICVHPWFQFLMRPGG